MGGDISSVKSLLNQGGQGGCQNGARGERDPATGENAAIVWNAERNGKGGQRVGGGWESSVVRVGIVIPNVTEGVGVVSAEDGGKVHVVY